jgi:hypothetical protein
MRLSIYEENHMTETGKCSLCDKQYEDFGHNPEPLKSVGERCCDSCNQNKVIPARLLAFQHPELYATLFPDKPK